VPGPIGTLSKRWIEPAVVRAIAGVVSDSRVQAIIVEELDRALEALFDTTAARRQQLAKERTELLGRRARLVDSIGKGTLENTEAAPVDGELRSQISGVEAELERLQFSERRVAGGLGAPRSAGAPGGRLRRLGPPRRRHRRSASSSGPGSPRRPTRKTPAFSLSRSGGSLMSWACREETRYGITCLAPARRAKLRTV
jgi:hypothetical protein